MRFRQRLIFGVVVGLLSSSFTPVASAQPAPARCRTADFRDVTQTSFVTNTLIVGDCVRLPPRASLQIASGVSVYVLARRGLMVREGASVNAQPAAPSTPNPSVSKHTWTPSAKSNPNPYQNDNNAYLRCMCQGTCLDRTRHQCTYGGDPPGLKGSDAVGGNAAGSLRVVTWGLWVRASSQVNVTGGPPSAPGGAGVFECRSSSIACNASNVPSGKAASPGAHGHVSVGAFGRGVASRLAARVVPSTAVTTDEYGDVASFRAASTAILNDGAAFARIDL